MDKMLKDYCIKYVNMYGDIGYKYVSSKNMNGAIRKFMQENDFKEIKRVYECGFDF